MAIVDGLIELFQSCTNKYGCKSAVIRWLMPWMNVSVWRADIIERDR